MFSLQNSSVYIKRLPDSRQLCIIATETNPSEICLIMQSLIGRRICMDSDERRLNGMIYCEMANTNERLDCRVIVKSNSNASWQLDLAEWRKKRRLQRQLQRLELQLICRMVSAFQHGEANTSANTAMKLHFPTVLLTTTAKSQRKGVALNPCGDATAYGCARKSSEHCSVSINDFFYFKQKQLQNEEG